jgi:hypothetical protein
MWYHYNSKRWNAVKTEANVANKDVPEWATVIGKEVSAAVQAATRGAPDEAGTVTDVNVVGAAEGTPANIKLLAANVECSLSKAFQKVGKPQGRVW